MKKEPTNRQYFLAVAEIDCIFWMLKKINTERFQPIVAMVDKATGYNRNAENIKASITLVKRIIVLKKRINEDITNDKKILKNLQDLYEKNQDNQIRNIPEEDSKAQGLSGSKRKTIEEKNRTSKV